MKILVLGGAGDMGRYAVTILLKSPKIESITIADNNIKLADVFVDLIQEKLNQPEKLKTVKIDVTDLKKLSVLMSEHDIILNLVGPFYKFGVPILNEAIKAGKPFLDICDDWKPTLDSLKLNEKAKEAGITAIIGIGASPGITNLMAVLAAQELDEVEEIITAWGYGIGEPGKEPDFYIHQGEIRKKMGNIPERANAATVHLLYETLENTPIFRNGKLVEVEPLTQPPDPFEFPGVKPTYAVYIGHPENVTLQRTIPTKNNCNLMHMGKHFTALTQEFSQKIQEGMPIDEATIELTKGFAVMGSRSDISEDYLNPPPGLSAQAIGTKNGIRKKSGVGLIRVPANGMAGETSIPLVIAMEMLLEGKIKTKGVFTPEESIDPKEFFNRFAIHCGAKSADEILLKKIVDI